MKITIEANGYKYTIEHESDALEIGMMADNFRSLLVQVGFHPETADAVFSSDAIESGSWNLQLDDNDRPADLDLDRDHIDQQITSQTI